MARPSAEADPTLVAAFGVESGRLRHLSSSADQLHHRGHRSGQPGGVLADSDDRYWLGAFVHPALPGDRHVDTATRLELR